MPSSRPPLRPLPKPITRPHLRSGRMTEPLWFQLFWQRPLDPVRVADLLRHFAADRRSPRIVLEVRLTSDGTSYLLGCAAAMRSAVLQPLRALPNLTVRPFEPA